MLVEKNCSHPFDAPFTGPRNAFRTVVAAADQLKLVPHTSMHACKAFMKPTHNTTAAKTLQLTSVPQFEQRFPGMTQIVTPFAKHVGQRRPGTYAKSVDAKAPEYATL
ncbi:hypothetical protein Tdes44962_MAKER09218 [Teratosphaeria destructans]|uniref:Uncharacterized protein n=1 Tax=Teratosphaeria destructans TaxID=418781 RepID=A0A9W7W3M6_9PEZI|nr:hypothetical protein Tdes44962_MAKER09218 [Teratosphaeria destructans]